MDAKDLMIGCLIKTNINSWYDESLRDKVCKVEHIGHNYLSCSLVEDPERNPYGEDKSFDPIPLTPEILEKNGWKHEFDKTEYMVKYDLGKEGKNCWMMWSIKEHNLDVQRQDEKLDMYNLKISRVVIPCDYVHQLQLAMYLCGIKKEMIV